MKKIIYVIFVLLLTLFVSDVVAREVIPFNRNWVISKSLKKGQPSAVVNLPHTWREESITNTLDDQRGGYFYTKEFTAPDSWVNKLTFIRFKGVASVATVFVNGKYVGEHKGAFTAFTFDISPYIRKGATNTVVVNVDNSVRYDVFPLVGDYNLYGGIYRDVELIVTDKLHITPLHFSTDGVYITQNNLTNREAAISVRIHTAGQYGDKGKVKATIYDKDKVVATKTIDLSIGLEGEKELNLPLKIDSPKLWNGRNSPSMYRCEVEVIDINGKVVDKVAETFGLRNFHINRDKGFMLNGKEYELKGVTYMEDWANVHSALRVEHRLRDMSMIKEMGATAVRCAGYPHSGELYDITDRYGFITWVDLPFSGDISGHGVSFISSSGLISNGDLQLQEMVYQLYNNPSVCFVGLFSNVSGYYDSPISYIETLNKRVKDISHNVMTVGCSNEDGAINNITDAISWSQYFGWNSRNASDVGLWLNNFKSGWRKIFPAVGEYGAGGSIYHQQERQIAVNDGDTWRPESYQTEFHVTYSDAFLNRPYIWGRFINSMFDYGVTFSNDKEVNSVNDMGLVTYDRLVKKDAFYLYKALWNSSEKFIHITQKRLKQRTNRRQDLLIFSSCPTVDVVVNGVPQSTITVKNGVARVKSLYLKEGANIIVVKSGDVQDIAYIEIVQNSIEY